MRQIEYTSWTPDDGRGGDVSGPGTGQADPSPQPAPEAETDRATAAPDRPADTDDAGGMNLTAILNRAVLVTLVPLLIGAGIAVLATLRVSEQEETARLTHQAQMTEQRLEEWLLTATALHAAFPQAAALDAVRCNARLAEIASDVRFAVTSMVLRAPDGSVLCSSGPVGAEPRTDIGQRTAFSGPGLRIEPAVTDPVTGQPAIAVRRAIAIPGTDAPAEAVLHFDADWVQRLLSEQALSEVRVIGPRGQVIAPAAEDGAAELRAQARRTLTRNIMVSGLSFDIAVLLPASLPALGPEDRSAIVLICFVTAMGLLTTLVSLRWVRHAVLAPMESLRALAFDTAQGRPQRARRVPRASVDVMRISQRITEMHRQIADTTAALREASRVAGLGHWTLEDDGRSLRASVTMQRIFGFGAANPVPLSRLRERIDPRDRECFDSAFVSARGSTSPASFEFRARDASGDLRLFRATVGCDRGPQADDRALITGIVQDVTELRSNQRALENTLATLRFAGKAAQFEGWSYLVADGTFTRTGDGEGDAGGATRFDLAALFLRSDTAADTEERRRLRRSFWDSVGTGTPFDEVAQLQGEDGRQVWVRIIGEAERDADGAIVAVHGAIQDVDEVMEARSRKAELDKLLRGILDTLGDGFVIVGHDGVVRYMNIPARRFLGLPEAVDPAGTNLREAGCETRIAQIMRVGARTTTAGDSAHEEVTFDDTDQLLEVSAHWARSGRAYFLRDVTAERDMRARMRLLDAALPQIDEMIIVTKADNIDAPGPEIVFVNDAFERLTGYTREEAIGQSPRMLQGPDTERDRLGKVREALSRNEPVMTELTNYRKDGSPYITDLSIVPLLSDEGEVTHFVAVQRDITERKWNEEGLRRREEQFRLASRASNDVIWDWDMKTGQIWHSAAASDLFGPENTRQTSIEAFLQQIVPEDRNGFTRSLDKALSGTGSDWQHEYRLRHPEKGERVIADKAFIVRDADGRPERMVGAMSDVTRLRALDNRLQEASKREAIGQLAAGIAHDFNNLLTIILGNCDLLLETSKDDGARQMVSLILQAANRGAKLSSDLLSYGRRQRLDTRPVDVNTLISQSATLFSSAIDATVDISFEFEEDNLVVLVDPDKVQSALLNLILNAQAAIEGGGSILIRTRRVRPDTAGEAPELSAQNDFVEIDVVDDGCGMAPETKARAVEPFFSTNAQGVGSGLGLSTVYGLVTQSQGHMKIDSAPGQGTTVTLQLPAHEGPAPRTPRAVTQDAGPAPAFSGRVLVAEDNSDVRAYLARTLRNMGFDVVAVETGDRAYERLRAGERFELLCTDVVMPGSLDGHQLSEAALALQPDLKVLTMTAYDATAVEPSQVKRRPVLFKPFRRIELAEKIGELLSEA